MRIRSRPSRPFAGTGYSYASATHKRPRSSSAIAIGCFTSGSAAATVTRKPVRQLHRAGRFVGRQTGMRIKVGRAFAGSRGRGSGGTVGGSSWKRKWSKLTWPQPALARSSIRTKISWPFMLLQIGHDQPHFLRAAATGRKTTSSVSRRTISTRSRTPAPPPTRKLAYGCVTLNGTDVSVPCGPSPAVRRCRSNICRGGR